MIVANPDDFWPPAWFGGSHGPSFFDPSFEAAIAEFKARRMAALCRAACVARPWVPMLFDWVGDWQTRELDPFESWVTPPAEVPPCSRDWL